MQIAESLDRILSERQLVTERFYTEKLFKVHPEFIPFFSNTNMRVQPLMLTVALQGVVSLVGGKYPAVQEYLRYLGTRHRRHGVPQDLIPKFCNMLVATVEEFHGEAWDEELARQWRTALERATAIMLEGYRQDYHV
jgi:hemoglobin-like flavoprotein